MITKTFNEEIIQIHVQLQTDWTTFECIEQVLQLFYNKLKRDWTFEINY